MSKFLTNLKESLKILIKPNYLQERVDTLQKKADQSNFMLDIYSSTLERINMYSNKYPNDIFFKELFYKYETHDLSLLVEVMKSLNETKDKEEIICKECGRPYLYECSHENS